MGQNIFGTSFLRELTCRRRNIFFLTGIWGVAAIFSPRRRNKWRQFPRKEFFSAGSDDDDGVATFFSAEFPHSRFPKLVTFLFGGGRILGFPSKQKNIFSILRFIAHFSFDVKQFFRWEKNAIAWTVNPFLFLWNGPPGRKGKKRNLGSTSLQLSPQEICHSRNCLVDQRSPQKESKEFKKKDFCGEPTNVVIDCSGGFQLQFWGTLIAPTPSAVGLHKKSIHFFDGIFAGCARVCARLWNCLPRQRVIPEPS